MRTLGVDYLKVELPVDISAAFREVAEVGRGRPTHADAPRLPREVRVDLAQVRPQVGVPRGSIQPVSGDGDSSEGSFCNRKTAVWILLRTQQASLIFRGI